MCIVLSWRLSSESAANIAVCLLGLIMATSLGCSSGPTAIEPVDINASSAAAEAIIQYDQNDDGLLDEAELADVPGVLKYKEKYDSDEDGSISSDEIAARISGWSGKGVGFRTLSCEVLLDNRPLEGATVRFVPEAYLGDGPKEATGKTDSSGHAKVSVALEHIPEDLRTARMRGLFGGTYRIEVEHPQKKLPARYVNGTALGEEIARDTLGDKVVLELSSK